MIDGQSRNQLIGPARSKWSDIPGELVKPTAGAIVSALYCINLLDYHIGRCQAFQLAVRKVPPAGASAELLDFEEISKDAIIKKVKEIYAAQ